jgi:deoxycytidine triphosphate deaminase
MGPEKVALPIGDRLFQIVLTKLRTLPKKLYAERSGTYQDQSGVTLEGGRRVP